MIRTPPIRMLDRLRYLFLSFTHLWDIWIYRSEKYHFWWCSKKSQFIRHSVSWTRNIGIWRQHRLPNTCKAEINGVCHNFTRINWKELEVFVVSVQQITRPRCPASPKVLNRKKIYGLICCLSFAGRQNVSLQCATSSYFPQNKAPRRLSALMIRH